MIEKLVINIKRELLDITWFKISANVGSLLSSTRFSHVMSRIQWKGLGGQDCRSNAAPPVDRNILMKYT